MSLVTVIGISAESLLIISQLPQIYKSFKTKSTKDLSLLTILCVLAGLVLWLAYGLLKPDFVIVSANGLSLLTFGVVLYAKLKFS
ncbi:MAG: SemiSWEET family sugar transporter [Candidatus Saccharimonadales bacterium]